jgi:hypothetical protein
LVLFVFLQVALVNHKVIADEPVHMVPTESTSIGPELLENHYVIPAPHPRMG